MNQTCFSRARYTLPNLPRPRGFPMSKSVSDHRFSCFPACCAPSWPSCHKRNIIRNALEEQGMGMDKSRAPSFPFNVSLSIPLQYTDKHTSSPKVKMLLTLPSRPMSKQALLGPITPYSAQFFKPTGLRQPLQLKKEEPEGRRRKSHVSVSHSFLLLQSIHTPVGFPTFQVFTKQ